ncbi:hypothetical protein R70723_10115 [Paenibacillus sp. FSL R7-0273]|uniref:hypothetical protein n=1 Tax=Paenibacillus sp. FSL R7-0273 TaxID=1536772 RepID=UPI0004F8433B|nr:hypothetical protein [Paenibacillus sp. FSL R7-0273]AIQ46201.1 hypothetical protein R70723_10115 [Paenibacillus sp. FSL R7-0273]OMF84964.1 hypothetical protein BK144_28835 [Paenibacillus sp. FSL R7-0273]
MENISTGLKWVIGIIVTILIIAAGVSIYLVINNYFIRAQEQTLAQTQMINQAEFNSYDNKDVSGQDVISAVMRYKGRPQFAIKIKTGENIVGFYAENTYGKFYIEPTDTYNPVVNLQNTLSGTETNISSSEMLDQTRTPRYSSTNHLVNTLATFKAQVYRDSNEEVRLIVFTQQ